MKKIGVSLVLQATGEELISWPSLPREITYKGETRTGATVGAQVGGDALLVDRVADGGEPFANPPIASEIATFDGTRVVVQRTYQAPDYASVRASLISGVKNQASNLILAYCPQFKQANLTAQAAELALMFPSTAGNDLPEPYRTVWVAGSVIWSNIKSIREHSNVLEAEIMGLSDSDLQTWQQHGWPVLS